MAKNKVSFKLKSKLSELDKLCQHLERFGESIREHTIEVTISHQNNKLIFNIEDDGVPFNPTKVDAPDLECTIEECKIGGLGIHLAKNLMDEVCYQRCKKKNILTLKKNIKEAEPAKKRAKG
jgi:anti-sigma regulatory factor (Ser/Thr protein kinase)